MVCKINKMSKISIYFVLVLCFKTEELERTGVLLVSTKQYGNSDSTFLEEELVQFKSYFQSDVNLRQKFQLQPIEYYGIRDVYDVIITNDQLVFTDYGRKRLLIYNIHDMNGSYITIKLLDYPFSLSVINENNIAVAYYGERRIEIISINTGQVNNTIEIRCNSPGGISYQNGLMYIVIDKQRVDVMNMTGILIRSVQRSFESSVQSISTSTDSLFLIDPLADTLYCCDLDGSDRWKFTSDMMINPRRVTTDKSGNVYVTCVSNNVVMVSPDGKHHKELLTEKDGLQNPTGIYYDKSNDYLLVCNGGNCDAFLFDVKHSAKNE